MKGFFIQMVEGLHVIIGRVLQLTNEPSLLRGAFKYKGKNLAVLCVQGKVPGWGTLEK